MKKVFTALTVLAIAASLSVPAFAKHHKKSKDAATTTQTSKAHMKHAKKKGATAGQKQGQQETAPSTRQ
jgi:hypothetical protein